MKGRTVLLVRPLALAVVLVLAVSSPATAATPRPIGLTATATSTTAITLRWTDASSNELGFEIQRSPGNKTSFKKIATTAANATTYADIGLTAATAYKYRVRALKPPTGASSFSNVATATTLGGTPPPTLPSVPTGLGGASTCSSVALSWSPSTPGTNGMKDYVVWRDGVVLKYATTTSTTDTGLLASHAYSYAVQARDTLLNVSAKSAPVAVTTTACPPPGDWATRFGGSTAGEIPKAVAVDVAGNIVVVGQFSGPSTNLGGGQHAGAGGLDVFVAKYSPTGAYLWSKTFGTTGEESASAVAIDDEGAIFVAGYFRGASTNLGGGSLANAGTANASDAFVAKYSSTGQHLWSSRFGGQPDGDFATGIAVDPSGDVIAAGVFVGPDVDFGGGALSSTWGGSDTFVVKLAGSDGTNIWAKNVKNGGYDQAKGVAVDGSGNVFVVGEFNGNADFGAGLPYVTSVGHSDVYLAKYSASGAYVWAKTFGDLKAEVSGGVAVDGGGNVAITGRFMGTVNFGGGPLTARPNAGDVFVARFTGTGAHVWSKRAGDTAINYGNGIATDAAGNVVVTGAFNGTIDFGGGPLASAPWYVADIFVAEYSPTGVHLSSNRYGSTTVDSGEGVAFGPNGAVVTGRFAGTVDFGGGPLTSAGYYDGFLLGLGQ